MRKLIVGHKIKIVFIVFLLTALFGSLRIYNLWYSEYTPDETTVMWAIKHKNDFNVNYLLNQKKGPFQFIIAYVTNLFVPDYNNEFAYRLPFSIINIVGLIVMYFAVLRITGKTWVTLVSSIIFGLNGFVVAFGRIVQYQNLNIFFSFLAVYFYSFLTDRKTNFKKQKIMSILGTSSLILSLLSHWDVLFILPIVIYLWTRYLKFSPAPLNEKKEIVNINASIVIFLVIPFITIYLNMFLSSSSQQDYFFSRIGGVFYSFREIPNKFDEYQTRVLLYNPFFYMPVVAVLSALSLLEWKKSRVFWIWTIVIAAVFILLVKKPGTHLYNIFIPISILCGYGFYSLAKYFKRILVLIPIILLAFIVYVLWYQNYLLFVNTQKEYPWDQEIIFKYKTVKYDHLSLTNNILGFPIRRGWVEINNIINNDLFERKKTEGNNFIPSFITNEVKSISSFYLDIPVGNSLARYGIGVKKPFSFEKDYSFPQYHNKKTIGKIGVNGGTSARIYVIYNDVKK